jgi:hypothetical protein
MPERTARPSLVVAASLVVVALVLTVWRAPQYLVAPSFWAEEGALYFVGAWNGGVLNGLVHRPTGYLNLWANLATSLAAWLVSIGAITMTSAPRVTAVAALVAQLAPIALVATATSPVWGGPIRRTVAVAIVLVGARTGGMWLNTINSQYFLALAAVVVLLEPAEIGRARSWTYAGVVALAGLSGPVASFTAPLLLAKGWWTRSRPALLVAIVATLCTLIQVAAIAAGGADTLGVRAQGLSALVFALLVWTRTVVLPVFGPSAALRFVGHFDPSASSLLVSTWLLVTLALLVATLALGAPREARWLGASYVLVSIGSFAGAVGDVRAFLGNYEGGARYAFVPGVLLLWLLLANVRRDRRVQSLVCAALLVVGLATSATTWRESVRWRESWPVWAAEVEAWRRDPRTPLRIWPKPWTMQLARPPAQAASTRRPVRTSNRCPCHGHVTTPVASTAAASSGPPRCGQVVENAQRAPSSVISRRRAGSRPSTYAWRRTIIASSSSQSRV